MTLSQSHIPSNNKYPPLHQIMLEDPLSIVTVVIYLILFATTGSIWIYTKKDHLILLWKKITLTGSHIMLGCPPIEQSAASNNGINGIEIRNVIKEASVSLAFMAMIFILFSPSTISRAIAMKNIEDIKTGHGRLWIYISRITIPILSYIVLPACIIGNNSKMRSTLIREFLSKLNLKFMDR